MYAHKDSEIFPETNCTKVTNAQQYYVQISYTEFDPNKIRRWQ